MAISEYEKKELEKLRECSDKNYEEASVYTVLLDLVEQISLEDPF